LDSYETVLNYIRTTTSTTGFRCQARLDTTLYPTGVTVTDEEFACLSLRPHRRFPPLELYYLPQNAWEAR